MAQEATKEDLVKLLQKVERTMVMDDPDHPWIPGIRAQPLLREIRDTVWPLVLKQAGS